jgi:hypothetical protein
MRASAAGANRRCWRVREERKKAMALKIVQGAADVKGRLNSTKQRGEGSSPDCPAGAIPPTWIRMGDAR